MTDLLSRPFLRRTEPAWGSTVPWLAGVLAAAWALVAGLAIAALPAILVDHRGCFGTGGRSGAYRCSDLARRTPGRPADRRR